MSGAFHPEVQTISSFAGQECSQEIFWHMKTVICVFLGKKVSRNKLIPDNLAKLIPDNTRMILVSYIYLVLICVR